MRLRVIPKVVRRISIGSFAQATPGVKAEFVRDPEQGTTFESARKAFPGALGYGMERLAGLLGHLLDPSPTTARVCCSETNKAFSPSGFSLGRVVQALLSERAGDAPLHCGAVVAAQCEVPDQVDLAARIISA